MSYNEEMNKILGQSQKSTQKAVDEMLKSEEFNDTIQIMGLIKKEFPKKVPEGIRVKYNKQEGKNIMEVSGDLNIKKNEEYTREINSNGKKKKYKIFLIKKIDPLDEKKVFSKFLYSVALKDKVKTKEIFEKHNKEIKWELIEKNDTDFNSNQKVITFELLNKKESLEKINEKMHLIVGLIEDIFRINNIDLDEDLSQKYNSSFIGIGNGKDLENSYNIELKNKSDIYFYRILYGNHFIICAETDLIKRAEKENLEIIRNVFATTLREWYLENIKMLEKRFPKKKDFENSKFIVERLEKAGIEKVPYNIKKFKFMLVD